VLWIDLRGGCAAAAACRSRPPIAAVSLRWGVMISRFPCTLAGTSTTAIEFCRNLLLSEQNRPKKKEKEKKEKRRENAH
jgi:hypothetical protein